MKKNKKTVFWLSMILYTIGYLYFLLVSLESCVHTISFYKSALGKLSPYFYSDWMFGPAIVCGIAFLAGCILLTKLMYGRFRRIVALSPIGGIFLQVFLVLLFAVLSRNAEMKYGYVILPAVLLIYLLLIWLLCLREYKKYL